RINDLDKQSLNLLNQRAEAALQIGNLKRRQGTPSYVPEREAEILRQLSAQNGGPLTADNLAAIWREVLSACRALEGPLTVAYLGPQATFTHQAALGRFGATVDFRPARTIVDIFDEVERGRAAGHPLWCAHLAGTDRGQPAQRHALPRDRRAGDRGRRRPAGDGTERTRQDVDPLRDEERAGIALSDPGAVRAGGPEPEQDRVASGEEPGLGVRDLRRFRGPSRDAGGGRRAAGNRGADAVREGPVLVPRGIRRGHAHAVGVARQTAHPRNSAIRAREAARAD